MASFPPPRLAVIGAGFLGRTIADEARCGGWAVSPVVRSESSAAKLRKEFPEVRAADAVKPEFWAQEVPNCEAMVWSIAPSGDPVKGEFEAVHRQGAVLAAAWAGKRKIPFVYISSTSVYAEDGGNWVNEDSLVATEDSRSSAMVEAERACLRAGGTALRLAGLYGKERVLKPDKEGPERWLNLIHVEDAARAVGIALRQQARILNVCEDEPRPRGHPGGNWPKEGRRVRRNKRVSNARLRALGWIPRAAVADEKLSQPVL